MATRELTAAGLTVKTTDEVRDDLRDAVHGSSEFGEETSVGSSSVMGQIIDVHAASISDLDDMAQAVYDAFNLDAAEGVSLDNLAALVGLVRKAATYSTVILTLGGTPTTVIPSGSRARVPDGTIVALDAEATIGGGGTVDAAATATETGPLEAAAGSITEIVDAVSGWDTVTNAEDATLGTNVETDEELLARRERSLAVGGNCTDQAIRANLEALPDVTSASVISNRTLVTDSYGIPGKAFLAVLWPTGLDEERVAETIWLSAPAGIRAHGDEEYVITDDQDYQQTVRFSYATPQEVYLVANVTTKTGYPLDGDDLVEIALLNHGNTFRPGQNVEPDYFEGYVLYDSDDQVEGIAAITVLAKIGGWPGAGDDAPISIDLTDIADFDSARIQVNS